MPRPGCVLRIFRDGIESGLGGDEGDRTPGLGVANAALSQLSYIPSPKKRGEHIYTLIQCQELVDKTDMFSLYFNTHKSHRHLKVFNIITDLFRYLIHTGDIHGEN